MKYLKNLILSFREIFLLFILQNAIIISCLFIFGMDKSIIIGSIFICIIEIIYVIFKYKGKKIKVEQYNLFPYILLGIGITTTYNMILFAMNLGNEVDTNINIVFNIICSGIVGPIFEETLFRYSFINYLKKFNNTKMSIIISSIVFAVCHTGITTIMYAFIIGLVNSYLYIKKKNILVPIVIHMSANIFVNVLNIFNPYILIIGIFLIVLSVTIIRDGKD